MYSLVVQVQDGVEVASLFGSELCLCDFRSNSGCGWPACAVFTILTRRHDVRMEETIYAQAYLICFDK